MSASDFEEQVFKYLWRGFVLAGLLTLLWSAFIPEQNPQAPSPAPGATNTASNKTRLSGSATN